MMDLPVRLFPPALLGGLAVYLAITMLWLQPIVEARMAERHLIPQCKVNLQHAENTTPLPYNPKVSQLEATIYALENSPMRELPFVKEGLDIARVQLEAIRPSKRRISKIDRGNICGCAVDAALEQLGIRMTAHVASLRTHVPNALRTIDKNIIAIANQGQCGALPWK